MRLSVFVGAAVAACLAAGAGSAQTLEKVTSEGVLNCGVNTGLTGFATFTDDGNAEGFDVMFCRAIAIAVLGDGNAVNFVRLSAKDRFEALTEGEIDVLSRNTTVSFSHDVGQKVDFAGVNYYDGQGFIVPTALGVTSARDLDEANICVQMGTTTALNLADFFRSNNMTYEPVPIETASDAQQQYLAGACDAYSADISGLAATRATFENPGAHVILPEIISKEPMGPVVRQGDDDWADIVRWVLYALISAEEYGVTSANVDELAQGTENIEINRLLGTEGELGAMFGLDANWAARVIKGVGNYGEIFEKNIGENTPVGLSRGLNAQWTNGGLLYSPPFR